MEFQPGTFVQFKAICTIHLGSVEKGTNLQPGNVIEYDGSTTRISGKDYNIASIAGAIRVGWLVPLTDNVSRYVPQPAGVQVRPATSASQERGATMVIEKAVDDERQVGSLDESNARRKEALNNQFNGHAQVQATPETAAQAQVQPVSQVRVATQQVPEPKKYTVVYEEAPLEVTYPMGQAVQSKTVDPRTIRVDDSNNAGARPVAQLRPAKMDPVNVLSDDYRTVLSKLDPVHGSSPVVAKVVAPVSRTNADAVGGIPINQTHSTGATGDVAVATWADDLEGLLGDSAVSTGKPAPGPVMGSDDAVAPAVDHTPPLVWDKSTHWRTRVKTALGQYADDPSAIRQIMAQEDPAVVKFIEEGLAKLG
jgi:hypothetical protein